MTRTHTPDLEMGLYNSQINTETLLLFSSTVEPLITATFTSKVRWPLLGGGRYS